MNTNSSMKFGLLGLSIFLFVFSPAGSASPSQGLHIGKPPGELLWDSSKGTGLMIHGLQDTVRGHVRAATKDRKVEIQWVYTPGADPRINTSEDVSYAVRYWPTDFVVVDDNTLCVAGKERNPSNATVIEIWTFDDAFGLEGYNFQTGKVTYSVFPAERTSVEQFYDAAVSGRDMVQGMFVLRGTPVGSAPVLLVEFWDSKEVFSIDTSSGQLDLVASPATSLPGVIHEPGLTFPTTHFRWQKEHNSLGFVYVFAPTAAWLEDAKTVVLYDQDKDGVLDGSLFLDKSEWAISGLESTSNYVQ